MSALMGRRVLAIGAGLAPVAQGPLFGVVLEVAGVERLSHIAPGAVDLVLIDADSAAPEALAVGLAALAAHPAPPPTLLMGEQLPAGLVRALMRLQRSDVLEAPFTPDELAAAAEALLAAPPPGVALAAGPGAPSRCWAITGAVGGAGATTMAVEIATMLGLRRSRPRGVCLIDLNLADGAAAAYLGAKAALPLGELGAAADRIDAGLIAAFATPVGKGLDLLACPRDPMAFTRTSRDAVLKVLDLACETYEAGVVDRPRHPRDWTLEALRGADEVLVVSELTVPALLAARSLSDEIEAELPAGMRPRIVLNRLSSRMFGPAPSMAEAERALQRKADGGISSDWEAAAASANLGGPISQHRPKSKIVRDVAALIDHLLTDSSAQRAAAAQAA